MSCLLEMCLFGTSNWIRKSNQIRSNPAQDARPNLAKSKTYVTCRRSGRTRRDLSIGKILLPVTLGPHLPWAHLERWGGAGGRRRTAASCHRPAGTPLHHCSDKSLTELARMYNRCIRGWITCHSTQLRPTLRV
jgi:hypothetical protein